MRRARRARKKGKARFLTFGRHLPQVVSVKSLCGLINIILVSRHLLRGTLLCAQVYLDSSPVFSGVFKQAAIAHAFTQHVLETDFVRELAVLRVHRDREEAKERMDEEV